MNKNEVLVKCHKCNFRELKYSKKKEVVTTFCRQANCYHYELAHCPFLDERKRK